jgi:tRNA(Ile)-lysidine synthase
MGGERLKIKPNTPSRSLKNLYQEAGVPPWQRQIPLLFIDGTLVAAEGLGVSITHLTTKGLRVWPEWSYLDSEKQNPVKS